MVAPHNKQKILKKKKWGKMQRAALESVNLVLLQVEKQNTLAAPNA